MVTWLPQATPMTSTIGANPVTVSTADRNRRVMFHATWSATKTWTTTALGTRIRAMATSGCPHQFNPDGRLITMAIGSGSLPGAGPGLMTRRGATHRSTMGGGFL